MDTLHRKIESLTKRLSDCTKELRDVKRRMKTNEIDEFRRVALTGESSARKRRKNRATTPDDFWNLNF
jgi:hypothetical protein